MAFKHPKNLTLKMPLFLVLCMISAALITSGCAKGPVIPANQSVAFGYVTLEPKSGAPKFKHGSSPYGDRRYKHAVLLDYSSFEDTYVYAMSHSTTPVSVSIQLSELKAGKTKFVVINLAGELSVLNDTNQSVVLTSAEAGLLRSLQPGDTETFKPAKTGEYRFYNLQSSRTPLFITNVVPGDFTKVTNTGRWEMTLEPGINQVGGLHPRLPSDLTDITLAPGKRQEVRIIFGVDQLK